jgi:hypothetical protein
MSKVFISYVRADEEIAERLYKDLKERGADVWLDKHDLRAGQGWRGTIKQAVRSSSHFIAVISRNSIHKRGYAQAEIHEALEKLKEIAPDEIYLIPVRLDETIPPYEQLQDRHYVNLFPNYADGLEEIVRSLEASGGIDTDTTRGSGASSRDATRMRAYRGIFDRAAFRLPCIFEFALLEVEAAVQDISGAMASGRVYSRDGRQLMDVPPINDFETPLYVSALEGVRDSLAPLRRTLAALSSLLCEAAGIKPMDFRKEFFDMEFFLRGLIGKSVPREIVKEALNLMDSVDSDRNGILKQLNALLEKSHIRLLPYITLSSAQLRLSADLEENEWGGRQRWNDFYLSSHRYLRQFLEGDGPQTARTEGPAEEPPNRPL